MFFSLYQNRSPVFFLKEPVPKGTDLVAFNDNLFVKYCFGTGCKILTLELKRGINEIEKL